MTHTPKNNGFSASSIYAIDLIDYYKLNICGSRKLHTGSSL